MNMNQISERLLRYWCTTKITSQNMTAPVKALCKYISLFCIIYLIKSISLLYNRYFSTMKVAKYIRDAANAVKYGFVFTMYAYLISDRKYLSIWYITDFRALI